MFAEVKNVLGVFQLLVFSAVVQGGENRCFSTGILEAELSKHYINKTTDLLERTRNNQWLINSLSYY